MKHYLIIGGSSGIGKSLCDHLISLNNKVTVLSRSSKELVETEFLSWHACDISEETPNFPEIIEPIDGLIYCPGTILLKPFRGLKPADFLADIQVNYLGAVRSIQKYLPNLQQGITPSIVLFSTVAVQKGMPFHASIAGAKGAIEGLTVALAAEFAPKIRVNAIAPSLTQTPLSEKLLNSETKLQGAAERHPLKRIGEVKDMVDAICYLLDATWVSGHILPVDGGMKKL
ncbi:MAG: SDR family oxidoreductase [bacterium]|nr:SDR family oxidoreductase [bacterium]